nr:8982_t:CDS:2 [Entrophospora candida]
MNDRTFIAEFITSQKRSQEEDNEVSTRQIKSKLCNMESKEMTPDYCELSNKVENEIELDLKKTFDKEYNKMKDNLKWKLKSTGRVMEDTLYECVPDFTSEHLIHSFTIDIDDPIIKGIFFPQELQEIEETNVKEDPDLSSKLYGNLAHFCSEAGKYYKEQGATKWLYESRLKLPKMMHDMFISLCKNTDWNLEKMEKMEKMETVEDIESFNDAIELITAVWKSKMRVVNMMALLNSTEKDVIVDHLSTIKRNMNNHTNQTNEIKKILPENQTTPEKAQKKRLLDKSCIKSSLNMQSEIDLLRQENARPMARVVELEQTILLDLRSLINNLNLVIGPHRENGKNKYVKDMEIDTKNNFMLAKFNQTYSELIRKIPPPLENEAWERLISRKRDPISEEETSSVNPLIKAFLRHEVNRYQKKIKSQRQS